MANVIRYKTSQPTKRGKRRGNVVVGTGEENYGPTSTTGYVNGITPPDGGYVVYTLSSNNDPAIYVASDEFDLVDIARTLGGGNLGVFESKNYIAGLSNAWILDSAPKNKLSDGLRLFLDSKNITSFLNHQPTTNFYSDGHFPNGNDMASENGSNPTNEVIMMKNPGNSDYVLKQTMGSSSTEYQINLTTELQPSTTYVLSGWYAESSGYSGNSRMFHCRAYSSGGSHIALGSGLYNVVKTKVIDGITWKYCYATITTPADYSNQFNWYVGYENSSYSGARYYTNLQMEEGNYPTPYAAGTRTQNTTSERS